MIRPPAAPARATAVTAALVTALAGALVLTVRKDGYFADPAGLSWLYAACWVLFAAAVWSLRRVPARHAAALVLAGGVALALTGLLAPPRTSTDSYRYAWDGRVQAAGVSPYDHAPADAALLPYRDAWLFPTGKACGKRDLAPVSDGVCTRINRPRVHTVYPPAGELYFLLVHALSPDGVRHKALQAGGAVLSVATTLALLRILRRRGDPRTAAYWAWCPAVAVEAVNNAHADVLAVLLSVLALGLTLRHRIWSGALLGLAIGVKLLPAVLVPGALSGVRRVRDAAAVLLPAAAVLTALYLPYVLLSHSSVLGYLGGYAGEEGYQDPSGGDRYALLRLVLPDSWAVPAVLVGMLAVSLYVIRRGDPERPWSGALLTTGTAFLLTTPGYSWYALLLIALVALDGRWEWLGVAVAGAAAYLTGRVLPHAGTAAYAVAALAVLCGWAARRRTEPEGGPSRLARVRSALAPAWATGPARGPSRPEFWRSPLRGPWLTAVLGMALLFGITILFVTGLLSYAAYEPDLAAVNDQTPDKGWLGFYLFPWPTSPYWLYRVTQGVHVTLGVVLVPVLLAKLWSVIPKLFAWPPVRSPAQAAERLSLLLLVGGAGFEFATGILNIQLHYIFPGSFYTLHFYGAWVFIGAFVVHVALRLRRTVRALRAGPGQPAPDSEEAAGLVSPRPAAPTISRRGALGMVGLGSLALLLVTAGQSVGGRLRRTALLAPHGQEPGAGPNGFQINKTAASVGIRPSDTGPAWRLTVRGAGRQIDLTYAQLLGMPQHEALLPIACVEGWSTADQRWSGVRLTDLAALVGLGTHTPRVLVESVQRGGSFSSVVLSEGQARDARSLLAVRVNGAVLSRDHGYPARVIVPGAPGVHNTKWVTRLTFGESAVGETV